MSMSEFLAYNPNPREFHKLNEIITEQEVHQYSQLGKKLYMIDRFETDDIPRVNEQTFLNHTNNNPNVSEFAKTEMLNFIRGMNRLKDYRGYEAGSAYKDALIAIDDIDNATRTLFQIFTSSGIAAPNLINNTYHTLRQISNEYQFLHPS
ncbi:MAG TPA: hypothetical protein VHV10_03500, partial [Ktedonobacteraceae bacterium]|nr:hypothetical protein [Ktedonobacteraceae bacterium]